MRVVGEVNKYLSDQAPWKLRTSEPERFATVLHVAAQAVSDCRTLLSPFLPHSAQAVHEALGGTGTLSPLPEIREVDDLDGGPGYPILMGDYRRGATLPAWGPSPIVPGTPLPPPSPVFRKLDDSVVEEELARLASEAGGAGRWLNAPPARRRPSRCRTPSSTTTPTSTTPAAASTRSRWPRRSRPRRPSA